MTTHDNNETTRKAGPRAPEGDAERSLCVMTDHGLITVPLPAKGTVVIGRDTEADVRPDNTSVSRRHACVSVDGHVTIEDLGSRNGTHLHDRRLAEGEKATVRSAEVFLVGEVPCFVLGCTGSEGSGDPSHEPPRHVVPVGRVFKKIREHIASGSGGALALLRVRTLGRPSEHFDTLLLGMVRAGDVVAPLVEGEALAVVFGQSTSEIVHLSALLRTRLGAPGRTVHVGVATWPRDGADADALMAHATSVVESAGGKSEVVIRSPRMLDLDARLTKFAQSSLTVLLLGETGVGKEVFARRVHELSPRASGPYVAIDVGTLSETLIESQLFGHERGAYTGAGEARAGLIESADKGTVFLDEIGNLSLDLQAKLLRVIETRSVRRISATKERSVDVRFVAATNLDLKAACAEGSFREDLYARLAVGVLKIPPLRERREEIAPLAQRFLEMTAAQRKGPCPRAFAPDALDALQRHPWPQNIRELRNAVERAVALSEGEVITADDLELDAASAMTASVTVPPAASLALSADENNERARIEEVLAQCAGNQSRAAALLGWGRQKLVKRIIKYGIKRPQDPPK